MLKKFSEKCGDASCMCNNKDGIVHCRHCNELIIVSKDAPENICFTCKSMQEKMTIRDIITYGINIAISKVLENFINKYDGQLPDEAIRDAQRIITSRFWEMDFGGEIAMEITANIIRSIFEHETQTSINNKSIENVL